MAQRNCVSCVATDGQRLSSGLNEYGRLVPVFARVHIFNVHVIRPQTAMVSLFVGQASQAFAVYRMNTLTVATLVMLLALPTVPRDSAATIPPPCDGWRPAAS